MVHRPMSKKMGDSMRKNAKKARSRFSFTFFPFYVGFPHEKGKCE